MGRPTAHTSRTPKTWQWMIDHFQDYPKSSLRESYPELANVADATKRYKELERMRELGKITDEDYEIELSKVLPLIDIAPDLK